MTERYASPDQGPLVLRPLFAGNTMNISVPWQPAIAEVIEAFSLYPHANEHQPTALTVTVEPPGIDRPFQEVGFKTRYGMFLNAFWQLAEAPSVTLSAGRLGMRLIRPAIDYEMHKLSDDVSRIIHERILTTFIQLTRADRGTFVHGAAMATEAGEGVVFGGHGGVGKTSLALEMGRNHGWGFISDDMVVVDSEGGLSLNANRPKIYAYNVVGDPELEQLILAGRSSLNRAHWKIKKRWPSRVRRSLLPIDLYPSVAPSAQLKHMLLIRRLDQPELTVNVCELDRMVSETISILLFELRKSVPSIEAFLKSAPPSIHSSLTWDPELWGATLASALEGAQLLKIDVPNAMSAATYKHELGSLLPSLVSA